MIKTKTIVVIDHSSLDQLVEETYGRTYSFQQQDGCKSRGSEDITVPVIDPRDYEASSISEIVNGDEMGISFKSWLERDPNKLIDDNLSTKLFWERNFYPHLDMIINDLHSKGLIEEGTYTINIDW